MARRAAIRPRIQPSYPDLLSNPRKRQLDDDDAEIAALEQKLGIKSHKIPKSIENDGLGDLIRSLDGTASATAKQKRDDGRGWLESKRASNAQAREDATSKVSYTSCLPWTIKALSRDVVKDGQERELPPWVVHDSNLSAAGRNGDFATVQNEASTSQLGPKHELNHRKNESHSRKENPYTAPEVYEQIPGTKYRPPSVRVDESADKEIDARLVRRLHGLLNRLSDANILSIVTETEKLYQLQPRQHITNALADLLVHLISDPSPLNDNFIVTHAGFISALHRVVGADFGACIVERYVHSISDQYAILVSHSKGQLSPSKKIKNLVSLMSQLYNLQVISANLMFDYIRLFLSDFDEARAELLWTITRLCGQQLRTDDVSSLKDIVILLQKAVAMIDADKLSVRICFIIDNIKDLNNNRLKAGSTNRTITADHVQRVKKALGFLPGRFSLRATEPLRVGLTDIEDTEKRGKWWLTGASWKGDKPAASEHMDKEKDTVQTSIDGDSLLVEDSLEILARSAGMNTAVRRAIFTTLLSANDCAEAHERLSRLPLKRSQQHEIPRVLLHCAGAEACYNPYYTLISKKLCTASMNTSRITDDEKSITARPETMRRSFQTAFWDLFSQLSRDRADDRVHDFHDLGRIPVSSVVNQGKLLGELIAAYALPITTLKRLHIIQAGTQSRTFLEVLIITLLKKVRGSQNHDALRQIFAKARSSPDLSSALCYFIDATVKRTDLAETVREKRQILRQCEEIISELLKAHNEEIN